MLSIFALKAGSAGGIAGYLEEADAADYYGEGETAPAEWLGGGTETLGLAGQPYDRQAFVSLLEGLGPQGEDLARIYKNHSPGLDLTFSAPKSVSAVWAVAGEADRAALDAAHDEAVRAAVRYIEQEGYVHLRSGKDGCESEPAARLIAAAFSHGASRAGDPQKHSHLLVLNLAQTRDGAWRRLTPREVFRRQVEIGAVYRAELASQIAKLGYSVERDQKSFRIAGVPSALIEQWSTRRHEIVDSLGGLAPSGGKAAEVAALNTRGKKHKPVSTELRHAVWRAEAAAHGFTPERAQEFRAGVRPEAPAAAFDPAAVLSALTAQQSTFSERELAREVALAAQCTAGADAIRGLREQVLQHPEIVRLRSPAGQDRFTTREMLRTETELLAGAESRRGEGRHLVNRHRIEAAIRRTEADRGFALSGEQRAAVQHLVGGGDGVTLVVGVAGAGKTTMLESARRAWESAGFQVRGAAIAARAAGGLSDGAGVRSQTLAGLLFEIEGRDGLPPARPLTARDVIVIDEGSMIGSRQMARLEAAARAAGAKLAIVGDERQLQAIAAGGAFSALRRRLGAAEIATSTRQNDSEHREAVAAIRGGEIGQALDFFHERGLLGVGDGSGVREAVAGWLADRAEVGPSQALMITDRNSAARALNAAARAALGLAGQGVAVQVTDREGHPSGQREIAAGDRIMARRNDRKIGLRNGDILTVTEIVQTGGAAAAIRARRDDGIEVEIKTEDYACLDHGYAVTVHKAQGATVKKATVLITEPAMTDVHSFYVSASRSRATTRIVVSEYALADAEAAAGQDGEEVSPRQRLSNFIKTLSRERMKDVSTDYEPVAAPPAARPAAPAPRPRLVQ